VKDFTLEIEPYLLGELKGSDLADFEQALLSDPELVRQVAQHREMQQRLLGMQVRKKVDFALATAPNPSNSYHWLWVVAVLLLTLAAAFWYMRSVKTEAPTPPDVPLQTPLPSTPQTILDTTTQALPVPPSMAQKPVKKQKNTRIVDTRLVALAQEYQAQPTDILFRSTGGQSTALTNLQHAYQAYTAKNYRLSYTLLQDDTALGTDDSGLFLRANARFRAGLYASARQDFNKLSNSFQFRHEARWNILLCDMAQGKDVKAALEVMVQDVDFPFNDAARRLMVGYLG
jgi:hypothetical protein